VVSFAAIYAAIKINFDWFSGVPMRFGTSGEVGDYKETKIIRFFMWLLGTIVGLLGVYFLVKGK